MSRRTWIIPDDCCIPGEPLAHRMLPRRFSHAIGLSSRFLTLQLGGFSGAKSADRLSDQEATARPNRLKDLQWMKHNPANEKVAFNGDEP